MRETCRAARRRKASNSAARRTSRARRRRKDPGAAASRAILGLERLQKEPRFLRELPDGDRAVGVAIRFSVVELDEPRVPFEPPELGHARWVAELDARLDGRGHDFLVGVL